MCVLFYLSHSSYQSEHTRRSRWILILYPSNLMMYRKLSVDDWLWSAIRRVRVREPFVIQLKICLISDANCTILDENVKNAGDESHMRQESERMHVSNS